MFKLLTRLFLRSSTLRAGVAAIVVTVAVLINLVGAVSALRVGPDVTATQLLGRADAVISLSDSAPLGRTSSEVNPRIALAVQQAGGRTVATEYVVPQIRPDVATPYRYELLESSSRSYTYPSVRLLTGQWPSTPGQAVVSAQALSHLGSGEKVSFFGGAMKLQIVGTFINDVSRNENALILAPGTWEDISGIPSSRLLTLDAAATRNVYWSGTTTSGALAAVSRLVASTRELRGPAEFNPPQMQTRGQVLDLPLTPIVQLQLASLLAPLLAGALVGVFTGRFISRTREILWAIGIDLRDTRVAALTAVVGVCVASALIGIALAIALLPVSLRIADLISTHALSAQTDLVQRAVYCLLMVTLGSLGGFLVASPHVRQTSMQRLKQAANLRLLALVGFVGLVCFGTFTIQGSTDPASISIAGLAYGAAVLIVVVALFSLLLRFEPRSLTVRLAFRRARTDAGGTLLFTYLIGLLSITGVALSILLTSSYAAFNAGSVSLVPRDQIVLVPELPMDQANVALARRFQQALQLRMPIVENSADQGSDRGDGATAVVNTPDDVAAVTGAHLTEDELRLLNEGGALTSHPVPSGRTVFSPQPKFAGASLPSRYLAGANPSFERWDSIILTTTALNVGLHPEAPAFVFTSTTAVQRASVSAVVARLGITQSWVETYRAPEVALPPTAFILVSGSLVVVSALVAYFVALLDVRGLARSARTLLSVGLSRGVIASLMVVKVALVIVAATVGGLIASFVGSSFAFSFGRLKVPLVVPVPEVLLQASITVALSGLAALWATRRVTRARSSVRSPGAR